MSGNGFDEIIFEIDRELVPEEVVEEAERYQLRKSGAGRRLLETALPTAVITLFLLSTWWLLTSLKIWPDYLLPGPREVLDRLISQIRNGELLIATAASLRRVAIGFSIALILGSALGVLLTAFQFVGRGLGSIILGLQSLPSICWLPLAFLWFGLSETTILFVVVMGALPSIALGLRSGIRNLPPQYEKAGRNLGASGWTLYRRVILPAALPGFVGGIEQGWAFAWRSLMAAEIIFFGLGLGQVLETGRQLSDLPLVMTAIATIVAIGILVDTLLFGSARRAIRRRWGFSQT